MTRTFLPGLLIAVGVLVLGLIVAFTVGRYPVSLAELADVLISKLSGRPTTASPAVENVVLLVRGPRVVAAVLVGPRSRSPAPPSRACSAIRWCRPTSSAPPRARRSAR